MDGPVSARDGAAPGVTRRLVLRNTLYLTVSQALTVPLSVLMNAVAARYLGAEAFGFAYLAFTLSTFGFLVVAWGHDGVLPAVVARDRSRAGTMLGSSLAFRLALGVVVYGVLAAGCHLLGYGRVMQEALALSCLVSALASFIGACKDAIRGFERTDIPAYAHVAQQLLAAVIVVPVFVLGGRLLAGIAAQAAAAAVVLAVIWRTLRPVGIGPLEPKWSAVKELFAGGTPFVFFGLAMNLQPNIDAIFLSKLAPTDVMGWYAVTRRLVGVLLFPASALIGALYPTLCRLFSEDKEEFNRTTSDALRAVSLVVMPMALGCALFPDIGIAIFGRSSFGRADENLRVLSLFVFLVYFSMPLGTCILAAGKQRAWSVVQSLCVVTSVLLDPLLVPWFQKRNGNGGMGLCVATVISEAVVVVCGCVLAPRGIFGRKFFRSVLPSLLSGGAMATVAWIATRLGSFVAAPLALAAYAAALWLTGGVDKRQLETIRASLGRKLSRSQ